MGYKVKFERGSVRDAEMDREQWKRSWKRSDGVVLNFLVHYVAQVITQITQIACPTTSLTVVCTNRCGLNTLYYFDISKQKKAIQIILTETQTRQTQNKCCLKQSFITSSSECQRACYTNRISGHQNLRVTHVVMLMRRLQDRAWIM